MNNKFEIYSDDIVTINGKTLNSEELTVLIELVTGARDHFIQNEGMLEDAFGISKERQVEIVDRLMLMFSLGTKEREDMNSLQKMQENKFIEMIQELKSLAEKDSYDPRVIALLDLLINSGDAIHALVEDLNEE